MVDLFDKELNEKIKSFFHFQKSLSKETFLQFLTSTGLIELLDTDINQELLWKEIELFSEGKSEINYEQCQKAIDTFLDYYSNESNFRNSPASNKMDSKIGEIFARMSLEMNDCSKSQNNINTILTEMTNSQLQDLKKVFNLLDLKRKGKVTISEVQELMSKYKFIKVKKEDLYLFLSNMTDCDINGESGIVEINYTKYSETVSKIEKQLLIKSKSFNFDHEDENDIEDPNELMEKLISSSHECKDYIMIIADQIKLINNIIIEDSKYSSLAKNFGDLDFFIQTLYKSIHLKFDNINHISTYLSKYNDKIKSLEDEINILKSNENQFLFNYEFDQKLLEENTELNRILEERVVEIEKLKKDSSEKDADKKKILNDLTELTKKYSLINSENEQNRKNYFDIKKKYDEIEQEYMQDQTRKINGKLKENEKSVLNDIKRKNSLNDKFGEEIKKYSEMSPETLLITLISKINENKALTEKIEIFDKKLKENENLLLDYRKNIIELNKEEKLLKEEINKLNFQINDLIHQKDFNANYRQSRIMSNFLRSSISIRMSNSKKHQNRIEKNNQMEIQPNDNNVILNNDTHLPINPDNLDTGKIQKTNLEFNINHENNLEFNPNLNQSNSQSGEKMETSQKDTINSEIYLKDAILPPNNAKKEIDSKKHLNNINEDEVEFDYVCYDFLVLRKNDLLQKFLEDNSEDVSTYEIFSDNIYLIDQNNKKSKQYIFITSQHLFIFKENISLKMKRNLSELRKLTVSYKNCNLIAFHFSQSDDILLEILRRTELLHYFRDLISMNKLGIVKVKYSDHFKLKRNNKYTNIIVNMNKHYYILSNFEDALKLGYLEKRVKGFISNSYKEKLVVLTNIGLLFFDDPNKPPQSLIPIVGSEIQKLDEKTYKKKFCFEIKTLDEKVFVFACNSEEERESWLEEFKRFKINYAVKAKNN